MVMLLCTGYHTPVKKATKKTGGVFGQSAEEVSELFYQELDSGKYHFETVVFSVPDFRNYVPFECRLVYRL